MNDRNRIRELVTRMELTLTRGSRVYVATLERNRYGKWVVTFAGARHHDVKEAGKIPRQLGDDFDSAKRQARFLLSEFVNMDEQAQAALESWVEAVRTRMQGSE